MIPNSVTSIGDYAFDECSGLTNVTMGSNVGYIGGAAFEDCSSLTTIAIPASVWSIEDYAFSGCSSLTTITVDPANFYYCSLDGVLFNKSQTMLIRLSGRQGRQLYHSRQRHQLGILGVQFLHEPDQPHH